MSIQRTTNGRYKVRWYETDGRERSRTFDRKVDARQFQVSVKADKTADRMIVEPLWRRQLRLQLGNGSEICTEMFNPHGSFVYLLWGMAEDRPLYVGLSTNVLSRLGSHFNDQDRRELITRVTLIRCLSADEARQLELKLIAFYKPELNRADNIDSECPACGVSISRMAKTCRDCRPRRARTAPESDELVKIRAAHQRAVARLAP